MCTQGKKFEAIVRAIGSKINFPLTAVNLHIVHLVPRRKHKNCDYKLWLSRLLYVFVVFSRVEARVCTIAASQRKQQTLISPGFPNIGSSLMKFVAISLAVEKEGIL